MKTQEDKAHIGDNKDLWTSNDTTQYMMEFKVLQMHFPLIRFSLKSYQREYHILNKL